VTKLVTNFSCPSSPLPSVAQRDHWYPTDLEIDRFFSVECLHDDRRGRLNEIRPEPVVARFNPEVADAINNRIERDP
jgi:hypothetical protein